MRLFFMVWLILSVLGSTRALAAKEKPRPDSVVPAAHWAYDALNCLAQYGIFTGYPHNTYAGRRSVTRSEFAGLVREMLASASRVGGVEPRRQGPGLRWRHKKNADPLSDLVREFQPELRVLGVDPVYLRTTLRGFNRWWRGKRPQEVLERH